MTTGNSILDSYLDDIDRAEAYDRWQARFDAGCDKADAERDDK